MSGARVASSRKEEDMVRKKMSRAGAVALALCATASVATVGIGAEVAGATRVPPLVFSGPISCTLNGAYKFSPALTNGVVPTTVTFKGALTNCSGAGATDGAAAITGAKVLATSAPTGESFGAVTSGLPMPVLSGTIGWRVTGGRIVATTISIADQAMSYDTGTTVVSIYATPVLTGGSFGGQTAKATDLIANTSGFTLSARAGTTGVASIPFGASGSTLIVEGSI
jgi:hypothetical protein